MVKERRKKERHWKVKKNKDQEKKEKYKRFKDMGPALK